MKKLFTKNDVWDMKKNKGMSLKDIQNEMEFDDIGQGYGYKNIEAFLLGKYDENFSDEYICYIPEYCYNEDEEKLTIDLNSCYTYKGLSLLCFFTKISPSDLFDSLDWQHPSSLLNEWEDMK